MVEKVLNDEKNFTVMKRFVLHGITTTMMMMMMIMMMIMMMVMMKMVSRFVKSAGQQLQQSQSLA